MRRARGLWGPKPGKGEEGRKKVGQDGPQSADLTNSWPTRSSGAHTTIREVPHGQMRLGPSSPANEMGASWEECGLGWKAQVDSEGGAS